MKYSLKIGKEILNFNLVESGEIFNIEFNEKKYNAELIKIDSNLYSMILDGQTCTVAIKKEGKSIEIFYKGDLFSFEIPSARDKSSLENASGVDKISAPMPGRVVKVLKKVGDIIKEGEGLIVVEAMKMESELKSSIDGKVSEISVKDGDTVDLGAHLITVENDEKEDS
tara:strand:- start:1248 stop:1754 length:507 start_codon:yes stop_codon:yes gene_type:complete